MTIPPTEQFIPDALDQRLFAAFPGLVMRKDLTQVIRGMSKAPSYVIEFMLGKYCANLFDTRDVREGLELVREEVAAYIPIQHRAYCRLSLFAPRVFSASIRHQNPEMRSIHQNFP